MNKMNLFIEIKPPYLAVYIIVSLLFSYSSLAQIALPYHENFSTIVQNNGFPFVLGGAWTRSSNTAFQPTYISNQTSYNRIGRSGTKFISFHGSGTTTYAVGPFSLIAGVSYTVGAWHITDTYGWPTLKFTYGSGTTVALQNNTIISTNFPNNDTYTELHGLFTPTTSGNYYIGVTMTSTENYGYFSIDDFSVSVSGTSCSPINTPIASVYGSAEICQGSSAILIANNFSQTSDLTNQWLTTSNNGTYTGILGATNGPFYLTNSLAPGNYYFACASTCSSTNQTSISNTVEIIVYSLPTIIEQPLTNQNVCLNEIMAPLFVNYSGGPPTVTYQWYYSTNGLNSGGTLISGANFAYYSPDSNTEYSRYYYCVLSFGNGCALTSNVSHITVSNSFQYVSQPQDSQFFCLNGISIPLEINVSNNSANATYQWYSNTTNSYINSTPIQGANSTSYTPPSNSNGLKFYFCIANVNSISCQSNISSVLVVADPVISQEPISEQTICVGGTPNAVSVNVSGGVGTPTYQWYSSGSLDSPIPGANSATLNQGVFNTPFQNSYYATINFSGSGCNSLTSGLSNLLVVNDPTILPISNTSQTVCASNNLTNLEVVVNNGTQLSYQWFSNSINSIGNGNMIANANYANYLATAATLGSVYYYCVIFSTASGCTSPQTSGVYQINTIAQPLITSEPYQTGTCLNNALPPLQISGNQDDIAIYNFFKSNSNQNYDGIEIATTPFIPDYGFSGIFTYYFTYRIDYPGCTSDTSDFYEVTITDIPQLALQSTDDIIGCSGAEFNLANLVQSNLQENYSIIWSVDNTVVDTIDNSTNYQTLPIAEGSHEIQAEIISSFINCTVVDSVMLNLNVASTPYIVEELNFDQNICPYDTEINLPTVILSNDYSLITPIFEWFDSSDNTITPIAFANTNSYLPPIQNNSNYQSFCQINFGLPGCPTLETSISDISIDSMNSKCYPLFNISEAISTNNDGINDYWTINELALFNGYAINIFNSFGQSIYQIKNTPPNWDGTWNGQTLPNGDYFYSVKLDELNRTIFGTISIAK